MGSHSVTCHMTQENTPRLNTSHKLVLDLPGMFFGLGSWSLFVLKDKTGVLAPSLDREHWVLGPGLGLEGPVLGPGFGLEA